MEPRLLPIFAVLLALAACTVAVVSYPAMLPLAMAGGAIVLAILTPKE